MGPVTSAGLPARLQDGDHLVETNGAVQWLGVRGCDLRTVPLLVIHGGPGANNWIYEQSVGAGLAAHRTLVLHEQRGCGRATRTPGTTYTLAALVADLHAVIDALAVPQVDLLGWSFGADLAARVALESPARVRRLVLQAPALDFTDDATPEYLLRSFVELASVAARDDIAGVVNGPGTGWERVNRLWPVVDRETANRVGYRDPGSAARAARLYDELGVGTNNDMLLALTAEAAADRVMSRLDEVRSPTLVMTGAHDRNVDPQRARAIAAAIPHARLAWFPNTAHMIELEEPQTYVQELLSFLTDRPPAPWPRHARQGPGEGLPRRGPRVPR